MFHVKVLGTVNAPEIQLPLIWGTRYSKNRLLNGEARLRLTAISTLHDSEDGLCHEQTCQNRQ